jgi:hypothetical protein
MEQLESRAQASAPAVRVPPTLILALQTPRKPAWLARSLTGARAPQRQSARAGGPRRRADRAKHERPDVRREELRRERVQPGRTIAGNERVLPLGCGNDPAAAGPSCAQLGRCANASEVEPAERHTEHHKPNPARTVRSLSLSQRDNATPTGALLLR